MLLLLCIGIMCARVFRVPVLVSFHSARFLTFPRMPRLAFLTWLDACGVSFGSKSKPQRAWRPWNTRSNGCTGAKLPTGAVHASLIPNTPALEIPGLGLVLVLALVHTSVAAAVVVLVVVLVVLVVLVLVLGTACGVGMGRRRVNWMCP